MKLRNLSVKARLVDEAGRTIGEVMTSVKRVSDLIGEIVAATSEQSAGINQLNEVGWPRDAIRIRIKGACNGIVRAD